MAGYPPPYPPPPGSPFGFDPRQQARFARQQYKAQARAAVMAAKAQRNLYRVQSRALRRTSILGPLLIVTIGVVLLLIRLDRLPFSEFADWYSRWWPLLFVGAGLVLVLEWAFDHHSTQEGVPFVRRGIGGGIVLLLILLAVTGVCVSTVHSGKDFVVHGLNIDSGNLGEVFGERHEYEQELDQAFPAGTILNVDNPHGDVTIVGKSGDDKIHIVVNKQVYSWDENDASSRADQISPHVNLFGGTLSVTVPTLNAASSDLAITIPDTGQTTVNANRGAVTISDLRAGVNVTANHGDIEIDRIAGPVTVHTSNSGSSFSAHSIQGDVTLRGHADDLNLTDVTGAVSLEGEFWGDTHLEHLGGPLGFRTNRTQFSVGKLDGMIDISPDEELTGSQIVGPTELHTRSRNISLERVAGSVNISNSNGTVDLTSAAPLGNVNIVNQSGEVTVTVPEHTGIAVQTQTKDGAIQDDLDNENIPETGIATHSATIGDGSAHLTIFTTHADINIHKGVVEPPVAPAPPAAPGASAPLATKPEAPPTPTKPEPKPHPAPPKKPEAPANPDSKSI
jgi:DUF4097 and DUF4098 domain-containing protein YvlB